jgi:DNA-binding XRE family transcriptional regulator
MNHLRDIRKRRGMSKWRLARESGLNWKTIHRIERGEHAPFESSKETIASVLGVSVEEIFPAKEVAHIFIIEPRPVIEKRKPSKSKKTDLTGYLLDKNIRRCGNVQVRLISDRKKTVRVRSEADGRFTFKNIPGGSYQIASRFITQDIVI